MHFAFTDFWNDKITFCRNSYRQARNLRSKCLSRLSRGNSQFLADEIYGGRRRGKHAALLSAVSIVWAHKFAREFVESTAYTNTRRSRELAQIKTRRSRPRVIAGARRDLFL